MRPVEPTGRLEGVEHALEHRPLSDAVEDAERALPRELSGDEMRRLHPTLRPKAQLVLHGDVVYKLDGDVWTPLQSSLDSERGRRETAFVAAAVAVMRAQDGLVEEPTPADLEALTTQRQAEREAWTAYRELLDR